MAWVMVFDGVDDTVNFTDELLAVGDVITLRYRQQAGGATNGSYFMDSGATGIRPYVYMRNDNGRIDFNASVMTIKLDGVPVTASTITPPLDGNFHILEITITSACSFGSLFQRFTGVSFMEADLDYLTINKSSSDTLKWDATSSSHAAGTPILTDTVGGNNATGVNMPTDGSAWVDLGGSGVTVTVAENGPSFSEAINTNLSVNITSNISESGPSFTEAVTATLTSLTIQANITESGPAFSESISSTLTPSVGISSLIAEQGPSFTESLTVNLDVNITSTITELGPSFSESINISVIGDRVATITENGPSFIESIIASIPIIITVNPKNIIRVKRKNNTVTIKRKSNIVRVR